MKARTAGLTLLDLVHSKDGEGHAGDRAADRAAGAAGAAFPSVVEAAMRGTRGADADPATPGARAESRGEAGGNPFAALGGHSDGHNDGRGDEVPPAPEPPRFMAAAHPKTAAPGEAARQHPRRSENGVSVAGAVKLAEPGKPADAANAANAAKSPQPATSAGRAARPARHRAALGNQQSTGAPRDRSTRPNTNTNANTNTGPSTVVVASPAGGPLSPRDRENPAPVAIVGANVTPPSGAGSSAGQRGLDFYAQTHAASGDRHLGRDLPVSRGHRSSRAETVAVAAHPRGRDVAGDVVRDVVRDVAPRAVVAPPARQPESERRVFEPTRSSGRPDRFAPISVGGGGTPPSRPEAAPLPPSLFSPSPWSPSSSSSSSRASSPTPPSSSPASTLPLLSFPTAPVSPRRTTAAPPRAEAAAPPRSETPAAAEPQTLPSPVVGARPAVSEHRAAPAGRRLPASASVPAWSSVPPPHAPSYPAAVPAPVVSAPVGSPPVVSPPIVSAPVVSRPHAARPSVPVPLISTAPQAVGTGSAPPAPAPLHAATPVMASAVPPHRSAPEPAHVLAAPVVPARPRDPAVSHPHPVQSRAPASAPAYPMSPAVAPMPEFVPSPIISTAVEPRRVRAALLELQHRVSGASDVATAASRNGFGTHPVGDKSKGERKFSPARVNVSPAVAETVNPFGTASEGGAPASTAPSSPSSPSASSSQPASSPAAAEDERPRASTQRPRGSAVSPADGSLASSRAAELAGPLMVPALPLIPTAALSPLSAGPSAPERPPVVDAAMNGAATTREGARGAAPDSASTTGVAAERTRETAPRPIELTPPAPAPHGRTSAEPMHPIAGAVPGPAARAEGAPAPFVPMPAAAAPLMNMAAEDPSLHAAALGKSAHVRLDTGADGELALHMVVRDGVVDLRVDGAAARTLDIRPDEVRTALAGEGISLGRFETSTANGSSSSFSGGHRDGAADQGAQTGGGQTTSSAGREPSFADAAATQSGGGQTPAQGGFGGSGRHFDAQDRWMEGEGATPARPAASSASSSSPASPSSSDETTNSRARRRYHVTA